MNCSRYMSISNANMESDKFASSVGCYDKIFSFLFLFLLFNHGTVTWSYTMTHMINYSSRTNTWVRSYIHRYLCFFCFIDTLHMYDLIILLTDHCTYVFHCFMHGYVRSRTIGLVQ